MSNDLQVISRTGVRLKADVTAHINNSDVTIQAKGLIYDDIVFGHGIHTDFSDDKTELIREKCLELSVVMRELKGLIDD